MPPPSLIAPPPARELRVLTSALVGLGNEKAQDASDLGRKGGSDDSVEDGGVDEILVLVIRRVAGGGEL
ncbi:hypothetical protein NL676_030470 [Syzygium grande]|nr:hypothetical protein NL676_030470 [Syzygium grande]